ncbi:MAG: ParB/RepB/Spo0J family partition protein [Mycoplasmataceae bacterium]|nr:ParB/RepB/Spo0J family partition protein [Mycoplasmataceae bacterium]
MDKKKKLNKGLEEIFGGDISAVMEQINDAGSLGQSSKIDINLISANPYQPRKTFDKDKLNELSKSIKVNGLIQPIVIKETSNNKYYVISGERRLRASKLAGLKSIPAIIMDITDKQMQDIAVIENIQRENLHPLEEALSYQKIIKDQGITQNELAKKLSKSRSYIANIIRLLKLPNEVIKLLEEGKLSIGHARPLVTLSEEDAIYVAKESIKKKLNARETEQLAKKYTDKKLGKSLDKKDPFIQEAEEKLSKLFGTKVLIENKKITFKTTSDAETNEIVEQLLKKG